MTCARALRLDLRDLGMAARIRADSRCMDDELDARLAAIAARGRDAMAAGTTLDDVLHGMKHRDHLGPIEAMIALRTMSPMSLPCAKDLVSRWCEGASYAHVTLAELDVLGDAPRVRGVDFFVRCERDAAVIAREPYLLYAAGVAPATGTQLWRSAMPLATRSRQASGSSSESFAVVRARVHAAIAAWPGEIRVVRDEPGELSVQFMRALARAE